MEISRCRIAMVCAVVRPFDETADFFAVAGGCFEILALVDLLFAIKTSKVVVPTEEKRAETHHVRIEGEID